MARQSLPDSVRVICEHGGGRLVHTIDNKVPQEGLCLVLGRLARLLDPPHANWWVEVVNE